MKLANWHKKFVQSGPGNLFDYLASVLFFPLSLLYGFVLKLRAQLYRCGFFGSYTAPVPVISVGNLAVGGTGKTPVTGLLLNYLLQKGMKVAVVSRGYGRKSTEPVTVVCKGEGPIVTPADGGDEPVLLAQQNPESIIIVSPDRKAGISKAISDFQAEMVLLDDGFQHLKANRDLDILLLDAKKPFGNGFPLPLGFLREFPSAVERADILLLTRSEGDESLAIKGKPVVRLEYVLADYAVSVRGERANLQDLAPGRVGAFAGIAAPESFFSSLDSAGIAASETLAFADHTVYGTTEQSQLYSLASRCDVLLTTEKDLVKLQKVKLPCDCLAVPLELEIEDGQLFNLVDDFLSQYKEHFMLSDQLVEILACPKCKGEVNYKKENDLVECNACKLAYPVRDGIPVMLVDEAENLA